MPKIIQKYINPRLFSKPWGIKYYETYSSRAKIPEREHYNNF